MNQNHGMRPVRLTVSVFQAPSDPSLVTIDVGPYSVICPDARAFVCSQFKVDHLIGRRLDIPAAADDLQRQLDAFVDDPRGWLRWDPLRSEWVVTLRHRRGA